MCAILPLAASAPATAEVSEARPGMGTLLRVTVVAPPERAAAGIEAAFRVFERVDRVMNEWREDSPLSRLNRRAGRGWVRLPADLCEVLALGLDGARATGGLFDPTWAAVSDLWRFEGEAAAPPDDGALAARCALVGWRGLELRRRSASGCEARLLRRGMRVGLGGLAKGWAVDRAARALRARGLRDFLLQAGGDSTRRDPRRRTLARGGAGPAGRAARGDGRARRLGPGLLDQRRLRARLRGGRTPLPPPPRPAHLPPVGREPGRSPCSRGARPRRRSWARRCSWRGPRRGRARRGGRARRRWWSPATGR